MSETERCRTCRHWKPEHGIERVGACAVVEYVMPYNLERTGVERTTQPVILKDEEEDFGDARLLTPPDFGCTLHEPRD